MIIDLDNFKKVNDCMGHLQGDEVLKKCSLLMKKTLRPSDIIVRIGGDEFVVFLKDIKSREEIIRYTERLVEELQMPYIFENRALFVSGSIGIAVTPDDGNTFEGLYEKADRALYTVKTEGKNNFSFYEES